VKKIGLVTSSALALAVVIYVGVFAVYVPRQIVYAARYPITESPADVGVAFQDVTLHPADDPTLNLEGWWMEAETPKATLVFLHGGSSNRHSSYFRCLDFYAAMVAREVSVLAIDLRNHGASGGDDKGMQFGWTEQEDAKAAIEWAGAKTPDLPLYAMGISMGGATAIYAASEPEVADSLEGLILLDPLLDTKSCVKNSAYATTGIPRFLFAPTAWTAATLYGLPDGDNNALEFGKELGLRTLLIQDPGDPVTVAPFAKELAAANENITFWLAPELDPAHPGLEWKGHWGTHVAAFEFFPDETLAQITSFMGIK